MALWLEDTVVLSFPHLLSFEGKPAYGETASVSATASISVVETNVVSPETASAVAVASVSLTDVFTPPPFADVTSPLPVVVADGRAAWTAAVQAAIPVVTGTHTAGVQPTIITGQVTNKQLVINIQTHQELSSIGAVQLPRATVAGATAAGNMAVGVAVSPKPQVQIAYGFGGAAHLPKARVGGTALTGRVAHAEVKLTPAQVAGTIVSSIVAQAALTAAKPSVTATGAAGAIGAAQLTLPPAYTVARAHKGAVSFAEISLPTATFTGSGAAGIMSVGTVDLPPPRVQVNSFAALSSFLAWVMNTQENLVSNYTQFPFIALGQWAGKPVGATTEGIYILEGTNDAGQAIDAAVAFGLAEFGHSALNHVRDVYAGGTLESDMQVSIQEDGSDVSYSYPLVKRLAHAQGHRAKLGKGLKSRFKQLSISNISGKDFTIDSISFPDQTLNKGVDDGR